MGGSGGGRDLEIPLWAETRSRHEIDVATWVILQEGRDLVSVLRPGLGPGRRKGVATPFLRSRPGRFWLGRREVATWV